ncbi:methyl-accepting chemotaxis protein [Motiliproteus sp. MSK22-1]|uniref:methyl-accepting chemotaxis protein n=1 Tax=Motiliproteus sp. MSK22-1 TaxID=1897630 RepID=UPI0009F9F5B7|nr:methyl-accepting chemotaxis protein [Motiliproteus sp. MSK22-1]
MNDLNGVAAMSIIKDLSFRFKLILLVLPALLGLLYFAGLNMLNLTEVRSSSADIQQLVSISSYNNGLVHELQKERGATAGFLNSRGATFGDLLKGQQLHTDSALTDRENFLGSLENSVEHPQVNNQLKNIRSELNKLKNIRQQVNNQNISAKDAIDYYTALNTRLLSVTAVIAQLSEDGLTANQLQSYYNFLQGKERAGIERAVLSTVFNMDQFNQQTYKHFIELVTEQDTYFDTFSKSASSEHLQFFNTSMNDQSVINTYNMRAKALEKSSTGQFGIDSSTWFDQSTGRINQLKRVEDQLTEDVLSLTARRYSNANQAVIVNGTSVLVLILIVITFGFALVRGLTRQLNSLSKSMMEASEERLLSARAEVLSQDELGKIAEQFNSMICIFEGIIQEIGSKSDQLATISEETSSSVDNNHRNLESQRAETTMVATAMEEMTATVQEVASSTSATADAANHVDKVTEDGVEIVANTIDKIDTLVKEMNHANQRISELNVSSNNIFAVVDVIKSVAEQTNLLALNAAIEAARAGDQGRGFAVVADEVRSLAQRTQESTTEIETLISKFQDDSGLVSTAINNCTSTATSTAQKAHDMEEKLSEIQSAVSSIKGMSQQIAAAAEEQVAVTNEIAQNIRSINDLSDETTEGGQQISLAANEQALLASGLHDLSQTFKLSNSASTR